MTKEELRVVMVALGENLSEGMIDELVGQIDQDSNGCVDCDEFLYLMEMYPSQHTVSCAGPIRKSSSSVLSGHSTGTAMGLFLRGS
jgi:hypothetical protein